MTHVISRISQVFRLSRAAGAQRVDVAALLKLARLGVSSAVIIDLAIVGECIRKHERGSPVTLMARHITRAINAWKSGLYTHQQMIEVFSNGTDAIIGKRQRRGFRLSGPRKQRRRRY